MIEDKGNGWNRALMAALVTTTLLCATASTAQTGAGETDLPGTAWLAEDIDGHGVVDRARSTMEFVKSGQVSGIAACNRYFGPVSISMYRSLGFASSAQPTALRHTKPFASRGRQDSMNFQ